MISSPVPKRAKINDSVASREYELIYWPGIPGRGEFVRLAFEATSTPYKDVTNIDNNSGMKTMLGLISPSATASPPPLAPPILRHGEFLTSQTPNILLYLGPKLGLVPADDADAPYHVNQLALTALDGFSNEAHDTHHPVASSAYYDEQKPEAARKAADYIKTRLPKFLGYFELVLKNNKKNGGEWLYGNTMTYADLVLWQGMNGVTYGFPNAIRKLRENGDYKAVFEHYEKVQEVEEIKSYLASKRRLKYGDGIWRHYPELDDE